MRYHLAHIIPDPRMHGLNGYKEVIETVAWGLGQLGHQVTYGINQIVADARNIMFGGQLLGLEEIERIPPGTIFYNFEQLSPLWKPGDRYEAYASKFQIWDYSPFNLPAWNKTEPRFAVRIVEVGFAPILVRIPKAEVQDIDVLIYGLPNEWRTSAFTELAMRGLSCMFFSGLYGPGRDSLIARSKIVLNVSLYTQERIFEVVRVSYLLANRKAVVAHIDAGAKIDADLAPGVQVSTRETLIADTLALARDDPRRAALEQSGFDAISKRAIVPILRQALS